MTSGSPDRPSRDTRRRSARRRAPAGRRGSVGVPSTGPDVLQVLALHAPADAPRSSAAGCLRRRRRRSARRAARAACVNQPPPAPRSATTDAVGDPQRVHDLIGLLPLVAIGRFEQPEILRREQSALAASAAALRRLRRQRRRRQARRARSDAQARRSATPTTPSLRAYLPRPAFAARPASSLLPTIPPRVIASTDRISSSCVGVEQTALEHELADRPAGLHRLLRDLGRRRVADVRAERRRGRGAAIEQLARARRVGRDAVDAARRAARASPRAGSSTRAARSRR